MARRNEKGAHLCLTVIDKWNILNTRSPDDAKRTKNTDREKFIDPNDYCLDFLLQIATMFKRLTAASKVNVFKDWLVRQQTLYIVCYIELWSL